MAKTIKVRVQAQTESGYIDGVEDIPIIITGRLVKLARVEKEWLYDVNNPDSLIKRLKQSRPRIDYVTFRQRIPFFRAKFPYYYEWENSAVLTISSYEEWFNNQLATNSRNKVRISKKKGVSVKECAFDDDFLASVLEIYNETPIRQGKKFGHYDIDFVTLKMAHSTFLDKAIFLGAFWRGELIGFVKLVDADAFFRTMGILAKVRHRDKAPMNILISEAVRYLAGKKVKFFVYGEYNYGKIGSESIRDFKRFNGFEGLLLPRYYVPLTIKGKIYLKLRLHHGIVGLMPTRFVRWLLQMRKAYYERYAQRVSDSGDL